MTRLKTGEFHWFFSGDGNFFCKKIKSVSENVLSRFTAAALATSPPHFLYKTTASLLPHTQSVSLSAC